MESSDGEEHRLCPCKAVAGPNGLDGWLAGLRCIYLLGMTSCR